MKIRKARLNDLIAKYKIDCKYCVSASWEFRGLPQDAVKDYDKNDWHFVDGKSCCPLCIERLREMASQKKKKRGPKLTTGRYETRQELIDAIHCIYYSGETVTIEATGRAAGISNCTAAYILSNEKPSTDYRSEFLEQRLGK